MGCYSAYDAYISKEVRDSIFRQLWYLTEELSILSLFDEGLEFQQRTIIANKLLTHQKPLTFGPGKPKFPDVHVLDGSDLSKFIGPRSWLLFDLLRMPNPRWLRVPAENWESIDEYVTIKNIVMDLSVTNDTAERAVKKVTDYANSAQDGGMRGKVVEVCAWHHTKMSGYTKDELENII